MKLKPIYLSLVIALAASWVPAQAQTKSDDETKSESKTTALLNGFAEPLKPKVKSSLAKQNTLYAPIKKQDDAGQIPEIEMFVGESRVFPAPGVGRIAVGNGQIMTAAVLDDREVLIFANGVGTSSLFVWNADGRYQRVKVTIVPGDTSRIAREVAAFLSLIPHAKASIVGDKVIVEGENLSDDDQKKVSLLAKTYPQIVNFTGTVGWEQMVMMDVKVVEFPKAELRDLGLKWGAVGGAAIGGVWSPFRVGKNGPYQVSLNGPVSDLKITPSANSTVPQAITPDGGVTLPTTLNVLSALNLGITAKLNLLEQNGTASILAEPQLSARNGSPASFLAGGEFPYSVSTINGPTVIFKPYGIKLDITPQVSRNGVIRASIETEVSSIDGTITASAGPALLTRKTKTEFNVSNGETIVLSGLLQRSTSTDIDKLPFLGDIPFLGALFRSKRFQNKETELVIFVTPTIVDSRSPGLVDRIERATERLSENFTKSPYLSSPLQPGRDAEKFNQAVPTSSAPASLALDGNGTQKIHGAPLLAINGRATMMPVQDLKIIAATDNPLVKTSSTKTQVNENGGGSTLRVKFDGLVIRDIPNPKGRALLELGINSVVLLGSDDPLPPGVSLWRNVVVGDINGWVSASGVEPARLEASLRFFQKSTVARKDQSGKIQPLGQNSRGVDAALVKTMTAVPANSQASQMSERKNYRVILKDLAMRVSPDINALIVRKFDEGKVLEALPQVMIGNWMAVQADGRRGWVAKQWLQAVGSQN